MRYRVRVILFATSCMLAAMTLRTGQAQSVSRASKVAPMSAADLRTWDVTVSAMLRSGEVRVQQRRADTLLPGRVIERLDQYYSGVQVWGASINRQTENGSTVSLFGSLYTVPQVDVTPTRTAQDAKQAIEAIGGTALGPDRTPELIVLPLDDGTFRLAFVGDIVTIDDRLRVFIDAHTGAILRTDHLAERQAPSASVGHGLGVLADDKKVSTKPSGAGFIAADSLRPPELSTYDLRSNFARALAILNGTIVPVASDFASTSSNDVWNDPAVVDAHVYSAYTYDYYFKRFGRRGLDNANKKIWNLVHLVSRSGALTASPSSLGTYWLNAFYAGNGVMVYGEGLPPGFTSGGKAFNFYSGAIDIVGHELTHGVTEFTSALEYRNESGALNEAFSDIMATSIEFFFQPAGSGPLKADYLCGEDAITAVANGTLNGIRSLSDPAAYGQPDHYSHFVTTSSDNGGVHANSGIPNHAFFLAIEGGTNRTSGIKVTGVGSANREQIERIFYRAFAQLMPSTADFAMARSITLRAAQDLYGLNSAPFNAVRDAWTAVGVN